MLAAPVTMLNASRSSLIPFHTGVYTLACALILMRSVTYTDTHTQLERNQSTTTQAVGAEEGVKMSKQVL